MKLFTDAALVRTVTRISAAADDVFAVGFSDFLGGELHLRLADSDVSPLPSLTTIFAVDRFESAKKIHELGSDGAFNHLLADLDRGLP